MAFYAIENVIIVLYLSLFLKMLGLYLYTLIIGHKSCNMLSILHKSTLQREFQNLVTNNVLFYKK